MAPASWYTLKRDGRVSKRQWNAVEYFGGKDSYNFNAFLPAEVETEGYWNPI